MLMGLYFIIKTLREQLGKRVKQEGKSLDYSLSKLRLKN
ncbi:hypothetical protein CWATWH0003_B062 [Crocosphaera watsonii WH 0003]|uniref:Uncharacterized protein n=1 Tax=Crocosphaera watsonii WH 0003 TaxID=423471 RepID=G5JE75_CROWT|nr:hypothetical protein CWATWH0003_B062 [Crocosphaera watsonii WH 0003]